MTSAYAYTKDEPLLTVAGLTVAFGQNIVLRDVNFTIRDIKRPGLTQGQKIGLLAPSGIGKTTLFKRLAGLEPITTGQVLIGADQKPVRAGMVGVVPQNYLMFDHRTVGSSLTLAASMREPDRTKAKQTAADMLAEFGLSDKWKSYPQELSGGQRQRASIAEQLLSSSHFLVMDEPFSGLDILMKKTVCNVINAVASRDELNTIIFSTHDIESAVAIADTILVLGRDSLCHGARVQREIDLVDRDLAWHEDVEHMPEFMPTVNEIRALFPLL